MEYVNKAQRGLRGLSMWGFFGGAALWVTGWTIVMTVSNAMDASNEAGLVAVGTLMQGLGQLFLIAGFIALVGYLVSRSARYDSLYATEEGRKNLLRERELERVQAEAARAERAANAL